MTGLYDSGKEPLQGNGSNMPRLICPISSLYALFILRLSGLLSVLESLSRVYC